ncbi:GFA family protein [Devosia albogilva]|uniref:GFA family protein n=1 Tax=Devosia albogilva TaxID=429726 RepID=A0ABW5QK54_9HYPH
MPETRTYHGQCHCGAVRYTATTDLGSLMDCNCSRCRRLGWVMQSVPAENFELLSGADKLVDYRFNTKAIQHLFCRDCGIESFARGQDREGRELVMINVNALDDAPAVDRATIMHWNGAEA